MPRYFFDIYDGGVDRDDEGRECDDLGAAIEVAMKTLPEIGRWAIPKDGDRQSFTVLIRDERGATLYMATLTFSALVLSEAPTFPA